LNKTVWVSPDGKVQTDEKKVFQTISMEEQDRSKHTKAQLAKWGVNYPPAKGWRKALAAGTDPNVQRPKVKNKQTTKGTIFRRGTAYGAGSDVVHTSLSRLIAKGEARDHARRVEERPGPVRRLSAEQIAEIATKKGMG
jgi:hypothetical protein